MGYQQVRIYDVMHYCKGVLTPTQVQSIGNQLYSITSTTSTINSSYGIQYPIVLTKHINYYQKIPIRGYVSGSSYNYQCIPMYNSDYQTDIPQHYTFPYQKQIVFNVWESLNGSANWEYFRCYYSGSSYTQTASKTWSSVSSSSLGNKLTLDLKSGTSLSGIFVIEGGGMNTSRSIYYSDNVVSPGSWKSVGRYTGFRVSPGYTMWPTYTISAVTDYNTYMGGAYKRPMRYQEYAHRLKHVSVYVRNDGDGTPTNSTLTSNSGLTVAYYYTTYSNCSSYCSANYCNGYCSNMCTVDYT